MLNAERVAMLTAALRSGEFPQGRSKLRTPDGYCCLGVGCEVFRRESGCGEWVEFAPVRYKFVVDDAEEVNVWPQPVREWFGFDRNDPDLVIAGEEARASQHNDGLSVHHARTFAEIADGFDSLTAA